VDLKEKSTITSKVKIKKTRKAAFSITRMKGDSNTMKLKKE
jgi:hypothetical protein